MELWIPVVMFLIQRNTFIHADWTYFGMDRKLFFIRKIKLDMESGTMLNCTYDK